MPKEFEKTAEVLPFTKYGLSSLQDFQKAQSDIESLEKQRFSGLSYEDIKLYQANEAGLLGQQTKVETSAMKEKLDDVYSKIQFAENKCSEVDEAKPKFNANEFLNTVRNSLMPYPEGHPMNHINEIEVDLFGHLHSEDIPPISKRMKMLRRLERKKAHSNNVNIAAQGLTIRTSKQDYKQGITWLNMDKDMPEDKGPDRPDWILQSDLPPRNCDQHSFMPRNRNDHHPGEMHFNEHPGLNNCKYHQGLKRRNQLIGPKNQQLYTVRDNKIVRLERVHIGPKHMYQVMDIVIPENPAEEQLLEGTKMSIDDIRKIERFRDYDPGVPSKTLYLKNIAPTVTQDQVTLLFNQFVLANGGPVNVRLMTAGRMRGQAFVEFQEEEICIEALSEANGTIMSGQPIIAQFARDDNQGRRRRNNVNQDEVNQDEVNQDNVNQDEVNQDEVNQDEINQDEINQVNVNQDNVNP